MLKQWAMLVGLSAALAVGTSAFAAGDECAAKQVRADKAAPAAEQTATQSQSTTTEQSKQDVAAN